MKTKLSALIAFMVLTMASSSFALTDSVEVGRIPYNGNGSQMSLVEFEGRQVNHLRIRMPTHCTIQIKPIIARGEQGLAHGQLVTTYNDGNYFHFIYSVNGSAGAELNEIELGLNSPLIYSSEHPCEVRVFASGKYPHSYVN